MSDLTQPKTSTQSSNGSILASAGVSLDPTPNRLNYAQTDPLQKAPQMDADSRVVGPSGSSQLYNNKRCSSVSQGIDFASNRSSPGTGSQYVSPPLQPQMNSGGSLANECGDSQPNTVTRLQGSEPRVVVGTVPLQGALQASPVQFQHPSGLSGVARSPWSIVVQDPNSAFRQTSNPFQAMIREGSSMVVKPFLTTMEADEDVDEDMIVGAADFLVGGGGSISTIPPTTAAGCDKEEQQQQPKRPKGPPQSEQVALPSCAFSRLELLGTLKHPYQFTVKGDDDDSTIFDGFSSAQWNSDIRIVGITQQEVDDLRDARAGRPFSRQMGGKNDDGDEAVADAIADEEGAHDDANEDAEGNVGGQTSDIAQEWQVIQQFVQPSDGDGPLSQEERDALPKGAFVYLRFKYTHGVYRVNSNPDGSRPAISVGDMVVTKGCHRHEGGDVAGGSENVGTVVGDATELVYRLSRDSGLPLDSKELAINGRPIEALVRCTTNKDRKMFYQARRREASTSSCAERIVQTLKLPLRICDCEFQSDFGRLTLFYRLINAQLDELVAIAAASAPSGVDREAIRTDIIAASVRVLLKEMHNQFHCRVWALDWDAELPMLYPLGQLGPVRGRQRRDAKGHIVPLPVLPAVRLPRPVNVVASVVKRKKKRKTDDENLQRGTANRTAMPAPPQYMQAVTISDYRSSSSMPYVPPSPMSSSNSFIPSAGATVGALTPAGSPGGADGMFVYSYESPGNFMTSPQHHGHPQMTVQAGGMYPQTMYHQHQQTGMMMQPMMPTYHHSTYAPAPVQYVAMPVHQHHQHYQPTYHHQYNVQPQTYYTMQPTHAPVMSSMPMQQLASTGGAFY